MTMYLAHFGLAEPPFSLTPDPRYLYLSERHREALAHLVYGVQQGGSFVQFTGEVGTGKTTVCRCLLEQLPRDVDVALIFNPKLTACELLASVCDELRIPYPAGTDSIKTLVDVLNAYLLDAAGRARRTVLIIDEAQNLSADVLEQIRLLTNLETPTQKLLQVVLIGQPELGAMLARPQLRQLAQRVTARYHLTPFSPRETRAYVVHRLGVAGRTAPLFTEAALRRVHRVTGGVARLINVVCDRALLGGYAGDLARIDARTVSRAAAEVFARSSRRRALVAGAAVAAAIVLVAGAWTVVPRFSRGRVVAAVHRHQPTSSPAPASAESSALPVVAAPAPPARRLADVLADPAIAADHASAFTTLFERWNVRAPVAGAGTPCDQALAYALRCLVRSGTWTRLRRYDTPAVLELRAPGGENRYATVVALDGDTATLAFGAAQMRFPLNEISRAWEGRFITLWQPPPGPAAVIRPGARGRQVRWVGQRLDDVAGDAAPASPPDVFDERLRTKVAAFQRAHGLDADGVVGEETLVQLVLATSHDGRPRLSAPGR